MKFSEAFILLVYSNNNSNNKHEGYIMADLFRLNLIVNVLYY